MSKQKKITPEQIIQDFFTAMVKDCVEHNAIGLRYEVDDGIAVAIHIMDFPGYMKDGEPLDDTVGVDMEEAEEPKIQLVH